MYFSLPENIPPRPLGGAGVRKQRSALFYSIVVFKILHNNKRIGNKCVKNMTMVYTQINWIPLTLCYSLVYVGILRLLR